MVERNTFVTVADGDQLNDGYFNGIYNAIKEVFDAKYGDSVISDCEITEQTVPDQTVQMSSGKVLVNGIYFDISADASISLSAADGSNPRYDLISVASDGTVTVTDGTAAASPAMPTLPTDEVPLAYVYRAASDNTIETADITDCRRLVGVKYVYDNNSRINGSSTKSHVVPAFRCRKYITITFDLSSYINFTDVSLPTQNGVSTTTGRVQVTINGSTSTILTLSPQYSYRSFSSDDSSSFGTQTLTGSVTLSADDYDFTQRISFSLNNLTRIINFWGDNDLFSSNGLFHIEGE